MDDKGLKEILQLLGSARNAAKEKKQFTLVPRCIKVESDNDEDWVWKLYEWEDGDYKDCRIF